MMSLNPIKTTEAVRDAYLSYLRTAFRLKDEDLRWQFEAQLRPEKLLKGPILEATPPFKPGCSLADLITDGVLSPLFREVGGPRPLNEPLYRHQERAIRRAVAGRNLVVATGTASGKTECFLVPILNHLLRQHERGHLGPGVRALLLYPMNALATDQMDRLHRLLAKCPFITFGRYTGETPRRTRDALEQYRETFERDPLENELVSREQMWRTPPHLLLTNYAMLEYLLLRPDDHVFFDGPLAQEWRFLILDEVHTYTGAKGIETAMLLRRLRDRVVDGQRGRLQCIATSATVGSLAEFPRVADFATRLFDEPFDWVEDETDRQDVIGADRQSFQAGTTWGRPGSDLYRAWQETLTTAPAAEVVTRLVAVGLEHGVPRPVLEQAARVARREAARFLHGVLSGDANVHALRLRLDDGPEYLDLLAKEIFPDDPSQQGTLAALVDLAAQARPAPEDQPLLPARYHLFVRAVEGAYIAFLPEPRLFLERRERYAVGDDSYAVFELATCRQCGSPYLVGERQPDGRWQRLCQPGNRVAENPAEAEYYLLLPGSVGLGPPDEDEAVVAGAVGAKGDSGAWRLCGRCGGIGRRDAVGNICDCGQPVMLDILQVQTKEGKVRLCPACGKRSPESMVWRFLIGQDAAPSVLTTALYQQIPETVDQGVADAEPLNEWSSTAPQQGEGGERAGSSPWGRRLLIFSDSRQDAAFFAPYLNRTYSQILQRRLILATLDEHGERVVSDRWRVSDLILPLCHVARRHGVFCDLSPQQEKAEVWRWVLQELLALDRRNSLEGLGLLSFHLVRPQRWQPPGPLLRPPWSLLPEEIWLLFEILLDGFRTKGAILFPDAVGPEDETFAPRNRPYYFRRDGASAASGILSWNPSAPQGMNARFDFLLRLAARLGIEDPEAVCREALSGIWNGSLALEQRTSAWAGHFVPEHRRDEGVVYRMRHDVWEVRPGAHPDATWHRCSRCHSLWPRSLRGVCPGYRCDGTLQPCDPKVLLADNHYRRLYRSLIPIPLRAEEHTAQLKPQAAFSLQQAFVRGEVNVLSCSTTFELGVDVGQMEAVFMRNVPPAATNYVQRGGRAGRRTESTAFVLTYAQRKSHDLSHFQYPLKLVSGIIRPPYLEIRNEKIVRRHVHAVAFSAFWRENRDYFRTVDDFFLSRDGPEALRAFLDRKPEGVLVSLWRVVPPDLQESIDLAGWGWVQALYDPDLGPLTRVAEEVRHDVAELQRIREELFRRGRPSDHLHKVMETIRRRYLIDFLASRNVLPKYGFPVDVVELEILHHGEEARRLELTRDLRIALSEYAPGGEVVAGGCLWTSRYLRRLPNREWERFQFAVCSHCQAYQRTREEFSQETLGAEAADGSRTCRLCHRPLEGAWSRRHFLVPAFGFLTENGSPRRPGLQRPERTHTTRVFYTGVAVPGGEEIRLSCSGGLEVVALPARNGRLAVVNAARQAGFKICFACGFAAPAESRPPHPHQRPWQGGECPGELRRYDLGHEFETDILQLRFPGYRNTDRGFWHSLLYAVLEGASYALGIERDDLDGCLYPYAGDPARPALVLFDDVPGGAGHVRRIGQDAGTLAEVLSAAHERLQRCECGGDEGEASCYGCLRNYRNQFCHDELRRGPVLRFLEAAVADRCGTKG